MVAAGRVQAWVVGPGLGTDDRAAAIVEAVLGEDVPVLVDADALTVCARHPEWLRRRTAPTLLTPHDREFARFGAEVGADRVAAARALAADLGVTVLLKGDATVVADPDGRVRVNPTGTPALATAGTGDVLSGGCGALLAQGLAAAGRRLGRRLPARPGRRAAPRRRGHVRVRGARRPGRTPSGRTAARLAAHEARTMRTAARIDLAAIRDNVAALRRRTPPAARR